MPPLSLRRRAALFCSHSFGVIGLAAMLATAGALTADEPIEQVVSAAPADPVESTQPVEPFVNSLDMTLVLIPAGEFDMGAEEDVDETLADYRYCDPASLAGERPRHKVRITRPFYLGQHEVTLGQFLRFVEVTGYKTDMQREVKPSWGYRRNRLVESNNYRPWSPGWGIDMDHPVVFVSWNDATAFCQWLSEKEGRTYRLPTEAEWEYACRAGSATRYNFGDDPQELVKYANAADQEARVGFERAEIAVFKNGRKTDVNIPFPFLDARDGYAWTAPVGSFQPNAFGLYDMHGNAWEWCQDWYDERSYDPASAAPAPTDAATDADADADAETPSPAASPYARPGENIPTEFAPTDDTPIDFDPVDEEFPADELIVEWSDGVQPDDARLEDATNNVVAEDEAALVDAASDDSPLENVAIDPQGPAHGTQRVSRGGGFSDTPVSLRSAYRDNVDPAMCSYYNGFRVVLEAEPGSP